jgi:outer membrane lipoprotein-sorting protein
MDRRKTTVGVAAVGVIAGVAGLVVLASPAGAGPTPNLPTTTPAALVASVLTARPPAFGGTVELDNNLGLPALPGLPQVGNGTSQIRVWSDGTGKARISVPTMNSERTVVEDGTTVYDWNSSNRTVTEHSIRAGVGAAGSAAKAHPSIVPGSSDATLNPATAARELIDAVHRTSTVTVDGTDLVANRPAYDLVLTPKPDQRTLLREIKIAVDSATRIPLRVTVLANNSTTPALQIGFSSLDVGAQDPALFTFTPPAGATVTNGDKADQKSANTAASAGPTVVGSGWDTVVIASLPANVQNSTISTDKGSVNPMALVQRLGKPISGSWGSGWVISVDVGNAIVTADGRVAAGFVPQQVLTAALGAGK